MSEELQIVSGSHDWKYVHTLLNIAEYELDPFQYRLLGHYVRTIPFIEAGLKKPESLRDTSKICKMSVDKVKTARDQLVEMGYIIILKQPDGNDKAAGSGARIHIADRWADNVTHSEEHIRNIVQGSQEPVRDSVHAPLVRNIVHAVVDPVRDSVHAPVSEGKTEEKPPAPASLENAGAQVRADSLQESKDSKTLFLDQDQEKDQKIKERDKKIKDSREAWMKAIVKLFPHIRADAYAYAGKYISFFQGKTPKEQGSEWDKWKIDNSTEPITAVHVFAFGHWWHTTHKGMTIRNCQTIHNYFEEFMVLENLPGRLLSAEKQLAKALNLPEIEPERKLASAEAWKEIDALREQTIALMQTPVSQRGVIKYG